MTQAADVPVRLPWLVRALAGTDEVDVVPIEFVGAGRAGAVTMAGRGRCFDAEAVWSPVTGSLSRWDVALTVRLVAEAPIDAGLVVAARLDATDDPHWLIPGLFYGQNRPPASRARYPRFGALTRTRGRHRRGRSGRTGRRRPPSSPATASGAWPWRRPK